MAPKFLFILLYFFKILLKSYSLKSGHNFFTKKISLYWSCHNKKLLNLFVFPVLIKMSGSGIRSVYKFFMIDFSDILIFFFLIFLNACTISCLDPQLRATLICKFEFFFVNCSVFFNFLINLGYYTTFYMIRPQTQYNFFCCFKTFI